MLLRLKVMLCGVWILNYDEVFLIIFGLFLLDFKVDMRVGSILLLVKMCSCSKLLLINVFGYNCWLLLVWCLLLILMIRVLFC